MLTSCACKQTISCLLIQPNPDSALNATAGHLLQDDYEQFARQAKLMTSIHATIPTDLKEAALAAKRRGEDPGTSIKEDTEQRPTMKDKSASSSSVIMKKIPQRLVSTQSAPTPRAVAVQIDESDDEEDEDEASASKENDPALSPEPIPMQSPRRPTLAKRPLSDLPCPTEGESEYSDQNDYISPSERNVSNNVPQATAETSTNALHPGSQLSGRSQMVNFTAGRSLKDASTNRTIPVHDDEETSRPAKRICSDEAKENAVEGYGIAPPAKPTTKLSSVPPKVQSAGARKASAPGSLGAGGVKGGKPRIGLRRL